MSIKTAVIYARVSSREQEEGYSIEAQISLLRDYAIANGYNINKEFIEIESAKESGRSQFRKMTELLQQSPATALLVEKTDRLYRNLRDRVTIDEIGLEIHLVKENTILSKDSKSHEKFIHDIKLVVAKHYIDNLREETRKGQEQKAKQGIWPSVAPIGFINVVEDGRKVIAQDPERAPLIAAVFHAVRNHKLSLKEAVAFADTIGLTGRRGNPIQKSTLAVVLHNPIYIGLVVWNKITVAGIHEPIIDQATFEAVQNIFCRRGNSPAGFGSIPIALRGLLNCGTCGRKLSGEKQSGRHNRGNYVYYSCRNNSCVDRKYTREELLLEQIAQSLDKLHVGDDVAALIARTLKESYEEEQLEHKTALSALHKKEKSLRSRLENAYVDKLDGEISADTYETLKARWDRELAQLELKIRNRHNAQTDYFEIGSSILDLAQHAGELFRKGTIEEKRQIADTIADGYFVNNGKLEPQIKNSFALLLEVSNLAPAELARGSANPVWYLGRDLNPRSSL